MLTSNDKQFLALVKKAFIKQNHMSFEKKEIHSLPGYQFLNYYNSNTDDAYLTTLNSFMQELENYYLDYNNKTHISSPPYLRLPEEKMKVLKKTLVNEFFKINPTKDDLHKAFHGIFQSYKLPNLLFYLGKTCDPKNPHTRDYRYISESYLRLS